MAAAACLWIGVLIAIGWRAAWHQARASERWPKTPGMMITGGVEHPAHRSNEYTLRFRYEFNVGGIRHEGTHINAGDAMDTRRFAEFSERYAAGKAVTVYYDPADPDHSVLEPGVTPTHRILGFAAPVVLGMGLVFSWGAIRIGR